MSNVLVSTSAASAAATTAASANTLSRDALSIILQFLQFHEFTLDASVVCHFWHNSVLHQRCRYDEVELNHHIHIPSLINATLAHHITHLTIRLEPHRVVLPIPTEHLGWEEAKGRRKTRGTKESMKREKRIKVVQNNARTVHNKITSMIAVDAAASSSSSSSKSKAATANPHHYIETSIDLLNQLASSMPQLTSLDVTLFIDHDEHEQWTTSSNKSININFPPELRSLRVFIDVEGELREEFPLEYTTAYVTSIFSACADQLSHNLLLLSCDVNDRPEIPTYPSPCFYYTSSCLKFLPQLKSLQKLFLPSESPHSLPEDSIQYIRDIPQLTYLTGPYFREESAIPLLAESETSVQPYQCFGGTFHSPYWIDTSLKIESELFAALFSQLSPSLTELSIEIHGYHFSIDSLYLTQFTQLTALKLDLDQHHDREMGKKYIAQLVNLKLLESLDISYRSESCTADHIEPVLAGLLRLKYLAISKILRFNDLSLFSRLPHLRTNLTFLSLCDSRYSRDQLQHLSALTSLRHLYISLFIDDNITTICSSKVARYFSKIVIDATLLDVLFRPLHQSQLSYDMSFSSNQNGEIHPNSKLISSRKPHIPSLLSFYQDHRQREWNKICMPEQRAKERKWVRSIGKEQELQRNHK